MPVLHLFLGDNPQQMAGVGPGVTLLAVPG